MCSKDFARGIVAVAAVAGSLSFAERATGADYGYGGPPPAFVQGPQHDKVEFASNWYVRGDLAYAAETYPKLSFDSTFSEPPSVLNSFSAGAGFGYKVNNWFRTDLVLDYRSPIHAAGIGGQPCTLVLPDAITGKLGYTAETCAGHFNTDIHRWDLLANGYFDLGTWSGFTPYVGAGAGVTWARAKQSVYWTYGDNLPCQTSCGFASPSGNTYFGYFDSSQSRMDYQFAWAVMAGVTISMTEQAQLDVGYRFLDLGNVTGISGVTGASVTQRVFVNELRAGVRYMID
ncbi:MAG TPA: outer membrane beta-barrel protein [Methylocella sp.]|nr:outer membrane beta-barrel protein [Methylocella sp.]